jgi:hypothetical protein
VTSAAAEVEVLVDALNAAMIRLDPAERMLVVDAYRLLSEGIPVEVARLVALGWDPTPVTARLESWPGVYRDSEGRLVGLWDMAVEAVSDHELHLPDERPVWM